MNRLILGGIMLLVIGYGIFEGRRLITGPTISVDSPQAGSATSSPLITIMGNAQNISFLTLNDAPIYTDGTGNFVETLAATPGYTVITLRATDRFGRRTEAQVPITVITYCSLT